MYGDEDRKWEDLIELVGIGFFVGLIIWLARIIP